MIALNFITCWITKFNDLFVQEKTLIHVLLYCFYNDHTHDSDLCFIILFLQRSLSSSSPQQLSTQSRHQFLFQQFRRSKRNTDCRSKYLLNTFKTFFGQLPNVTSHMIRHYQISYFYCFFNMYTNAWRGEERKAIASKNTFTANEDLILKHLQLLPLQSINSYLYMYFLSDSSSINPSNYFSIHPSNQPFICLYFPLILHLSSAFLIPSHAGFHVGLPSTSKF